MRRAPILQKRKKSEKIIPDGAARHTVEAFGPASEAFGLADEAFGLAGKAEGLDTRTRDSTTHTQNRFYDRNYTIDSICLSQNILSNS